MIKAIYLAGQLKDLIPLLEKGRDSHQGWVDYYKTYPAAEKQHGRTVGDSAHNQVWVKEYNKRIAVINETIEYLTEKL